MAKIYNQAEFYMKKDENIIGVSYISGCFMRSLTGLYKYLSKGKALNRVDKNIILTLENVNILAYSGIYKHNIIAIYKAGKKYTVIYKVDLV